MNNVVQVTDLSLPRNNINGTKSEEDESEEYNVCVGGGNQLKCHNLL